MGPELPRDGVDVKEDMNIRMTACTRLPRALYALFAYLAFDAAIDDNTCKVLYMRTAERVRLKTTE